MASGTYSVSIGYSARGVSSQSVAIGRETWAAGGSTIALGTGAATYVDGSIAIGKGTVAKRPGQIVLGNYNANEDYSTWGGPDINLLIIGNGNGISGDPLERSNALVLKRDGDLHIVGDANVAAALNVTGAATFSGNVAVTGTLTLGGQPVLVQGTGGNTYITLSQADGAYLTEDEADDLYVSLTDAAGFVQTAALTNYLTTSAAAATYFRLDESGDLVDEDGLDDRLVDERQASDNAYHRKDAALVNANATTLNGGLTANEVAVFNGSLEVRGEMTTDRGDHNVARAKAGQVILVPEQGNLSMGEFHAGPAPVAP